MELNIGADVVVVTSDTAICEDSFNSANETSESDSVELPKKVCFAVYSLMKVDLRNLNYSVCICNKLVIP